MSSLWTVILSVAGYSFDHNLHDKRIGRNVIQSDTKRGNAARQAALHSALQFAIRRSLSSCASKEANSGKLTDGDVTMGEL